MDHLESSLTFIIVTYKEKYWECESFVSLVTSYKCSAPLEPLNVVVIDNTEDPDFCSSRPSSEAGIQVSYYTYGKNLGISKAYNQAVSQVDRISQKLVFLDQDTLLPEQFYSCYFDMATLRSEVLLACPKVYAGKGLVSPLPFKNFRAVRQFNEAILSGAVIFGTFSFINSGLMVDKKLFDQIGGYDERLFLDFCDHDFISRLAAVTPTFYIIPCDLSQNLSSFTDSKEKALERYKIYLHDFYYFSRNRNRGKLFFNIDLPHLIKLSLKFRTLSFLRLYLFRNKFI